MEFHCNSKEYVKIQLKQLYFDEKVADMVETNNHIFPSSLMNNIYATDSFGLDQKRLESVLLGYSKGLPPIEIQKVLGGKYNVMNGRHRVCATIINKGNYVPCRIVI